MSLPPDWYDAAVGELAAVRPMLMAALDLDLPSGFDDRTPVTPASPVHPVAAPKVAIAPVAPPSMARWDEPWRLDASELLHAYAGDILDPVAVVVDALDRIIAFDDRYHAVLTPNPMVSADALVARDRWRDGTARALEGVPVVVKDIVDTAGLRTTGGSAWLADRVPVADATCVARLRAAGALVLAKTATFELACGDEHNSFGVVRNPWDVAHTSGGSSSGTAAALAAGYAPLGIGSDTGGSIRLPSGYCGLVGLRPTRGLVPTDGVMPLSWSLDVVGPMARSVRDVARTFAVLAGAAAAEPMIATAPRAAMPRRVGVLVGHLAEVLDPATAVGLDRIVEQLRRLGTSVVEIDWKEAWRCGPLAYAITMAECAEVHRRTPLDRLTAAFAGRVLVGRQLSAIEVLGAHRVAAVLRAQALALLDEVDLLVSAGPVSPAPRLDALDAPVAGVAVNWLDVTARTMAPWSLLGFPVVAYPAGVSPAGLPVGVQLIGPPGGDVGLLDAAALLDATGTDRLPPGRD